MTITRGYATITHRLGLRDHRVLNTWRLGVDMPKNLSLCCTPEFQDAVVTADKYKLVTANFLLLAYTVHIHREP